MMRPQTATDTVYTIMSQQTFEKGHEELRKVRREGRLAYWFVGIFSFFANLLMLTGPLYMLQVYDRVLGSRSEATLVALTILVAFLYGMMGLLDFTRGRIMGRVGMQFQARLDRRVFEASVRKLALLPDENSARASRDLETVQRFMTSPVLMAFFDLPWTPIFLFGIALFHPWLGILAVSGGAILVFMALLNQIMLRKPVAAGNSASIKAESLSGQISKGAEMIQSMGMLDAAFSRWQVARGHALREQLEYADVGGMFSAITKAFRLFLQSAMLGVGAYLVLQNEVTPGAMIAGSILLGRALAPIELMIGQWVSVEGARKSWGNLSNLLGALPPLPEHTPLPRPNAKLEVQQISVVPPGQKVATLRGLSFSLLPGQALGVIGSSGSGKSTLARALTGVWQPAVGKIRLDGASLEQYNPEMLGQHIGYLPQTVQLFDGTVAENIARLSREPDPEKVIMAARLADAHDMILRLPNGYDTQVNSIGGQLSGGQIQRVGLARAMYGDPVLLVLDEPNSNLDNEGSNALNKAIFMMKKKGCSILIMAHRPSAIQQCEVLLRLEAGQRTAFGPKDEVLAAVTTNHKKIQAAKKPGGVL
jgi:ATP-binding cassette subfamily C protein